jgi:Sulfotransferase family
VSRVPDFFIVGHPKSGTTALYEMLRRHPQIFMPDLKEPRYFASDLPSRYRPRRPDVAAETYEDYLALFDEARSDQIAGEASPVYIWSHTAAENIARAQPAARIVAILREPASYLRSLHYELMQARIEKEGDLRKAIALEATRTGRQANGEEWPEVLQYTGHVQYVEQLRRFHARFPAEQVHVIIYDDFRNDNEATVRGVLRFLGVDDAAPIEVMDANPTVRLRSTRVDEMVQAVDLGRGPAASMVKRTARALVPRSVRRRAFEMVQGRVLFGSPQPPDEDVVLDLRRRFRPEVEVLSEYLGRDLLALWGYDRAD